MVMPREYKMIPQKKEGLKRKERSVPVHNPKSNFCTVEVNGRAH